MRARGSICIWLAVVATTVIATAAAFRSPEPSGAPKPPASSRAMAPTGDGIPEKAPIEKPAPPDVERILMAFNINNYGYIDVCGCKHKKIRQGSVTRRASLLRQLRETQENILLLDGGNTLFGRDDLKAQDHEKTQLLEKAKVIVESYNRMGYHAMTFGHFDLALGLDALKELVGAAKFPLLCANYVHQESGELVFTPFLEVEIGGVKTAILGLTINTLQPHYLDSKAPGTRVIDGIEAAKKHIPALRARNDVVVVLSQNTLDFNRKLATEVKGIDFILDPHFNLGSSKIWIEPEDLVLAEADSFILRSDAQGARLQTMDLWVRPNGSPFVDRSQFEGSAVMQAGGEHAARSSFHHKRYPIEPHFLEDPDIAQLVSTFRKGTRFVNTEALPPMPNKDKYLTQGTCVACHEEQHKFWQGTKHATAFASLEETGDQWRQDCIGCHVLGYGQTFLDPADAEPYKDVQCESCHGLNPQHPEDPAAHKWPRIQESTCLTCHNKDQTLVDFHFLPMKRQVACPKIQR